MGLEEREFEAVVVIPAFARSRLLGAARVETTGQRSLIPSEGMSCRRGGWLRVSWRWT